MIQAVLRRLSDITLVIAGLALFAMMVQVSADVLLKYVANKPIPGTLEFVSAYYMVAGVFLPIAAVELTRSSIAVDVAYQFMPRKMQAACMFIVLVGCIGLYLLLAYTSFGDAMRSYRIGEVMMGNVLVSVWVSRFILPVSFLLAGLVCLLHLWRFITDPKGRQELLGLSDPAEEI